MALSGNFSTNKYTTSSNGSVGLNLSWTGSQDTTTNTTTISWTLKSNGSMSSGYSVWGGPITVVIDGVTVFSQSSRIRVYGGGSFKRTGTIIISHDEDGNKTVTMSVSAALYSSSVNCTGSSSYTLDKIDRYALLETVANMDDTFSPLPTITYSNRLGPDRVTDIKLRISWSNGGTTQATSWVSLPNDLTATDNIGTYQFTNSTLTTTNRNNMLSACSTATTLSVQYELQSKLDGVIQTHTKTAVLVINEATAKPTWSSQTPLTFRDIDTNVTSITQDASIIVRKQSTLEISISAATGNKGATVGAFNTTAYQLTLNGNTYSMDSTGKKTFVKPNVVGTYTAVMTVTDSRGYSNTTSINIVVVDWNVPYGVCSFARKDNFYTETNLTVDYKISSVNNKNAPKIWEQHKKVDDVSWTNVTEITSEITGSATHTKVFPETGAGTLDNNYAWVIRVFVGDLFTTGTIDENNPTISTYVMSIDRGMPIFFIDTKRHSLSMNCFPDDDEQFKIDGNIKVTGEAELGTPLPITSGGTGATTPSVARANIGLGCTELFSGSMSSGSVTFANAGYVTLLVVGKVTSSGSHNTCMIPMMFLNTSEAQFCISDETNWITFLFKIENGVITLTWGNRSSNGYIEKVYGII